MKKLTKSDIVPLAGVGLILALMLAATGTKKTK